MVPNGPGGLVPRRFSLASRRVRLVVVTDRRGQPGQALAEA